MKHLIERCEAEFGEEFNPFKSGKQDAAIINRDAEKAFGTGNTMRCANGYRMSDDGKCMPTKGIGNMLKRGFTPVSDEQGKYLDKPCCNRWLPNLGRRSTDAPPKCRICTGDLGGPSFFKK
jgi:hypothetical protein